NNGTVAAQDGGTILAAGPVSNFAAGTLTGGTWKVFANSTLRLIGADVTTNAATLLLDGANANLFSDSGVTNTNALANFATNTAAGSFTVQNGRVFNLAANFSNA